MNEWTQVVAAAPTLGMLTDRQQEVVLAYDHAFRPHLHLHVEAYHQQRDNVAVGDAAYYVSPLNEDGSMANAWDAPLIMALRPSGKTRNSGVEISQMNAAGAISFERRKQ